MHRDAWVLRVAGIVLCAAGPASCALTDLVAPAGPQSIRLIWQGDTTLVVGDTIPLRIAVTAEGEEVARPHLRLSVLTPSTLELTPAGDSVIGLRNGKGELRVQFENALLGRLGPDSVFSLRVTQVP